MARSGQTMEGTNLVEYYELSQSDYRSVRAELKQYRLAFAKCPSFPSGEKWSPKDRDLGPLMKDYPARKIHIKYGPFRPLIKENAKDNRIAVHDLPEDACEASLIEMFKVFGTLSKVRITKDGSTGMLTGIAHVSYENIDDAERASNQLTEEGFESFWCVPVE